MDQVGTVTARKGRLSGCDGKKTGEAGAGARGASETTKAGQAKA